MQTQLEIDFVRWLHEKSKGVESRFGRWLETVDGDANGGEFCTECVEIKQAENIASGDPYVRIGGWNEATESDSQPVCERCGCILKCSPTTEMLEREIEYLAEVESIGDVSGYAWTFYNMLSGMGSYTRDEYWSSIKPHAERLMAAEGIDVVPDGFITYRPGCDDWYDFDSVWLGIYQWYAEHLRRWKNQTGTGDFTWLCDTSGRNCSGPEELSKRETPKKCIDKLLKSVGADSKCGLFLASIGLTCRADLEIPIRLPDMRCQWPDFNVRGRVLNYSPNSCHPDAKVLTNAYLQFCLWNCRWMYSAHYDYKHYEHSSWRVEVKQRKRESLPDFIKRIAVDMESKLIPVGFEDQWRMNRLRNWDRMKESIGTVFGRKRFDDDDPSDIQLTDMLTHSEGKLDSARKILMTQDRFNTLVKWIQEDNAIRQEQIEAQMIGRGKRR